jgi:hypothetical protein
MLKRVCNNLIINKELILAIGKILYLVSDDLPKDVPVIL